MKKETSAGAVLFRKNKELLYLLLHYEMNHWDFPKGKIEPDETDEETIKREIEEETGIKKINIFKGFKEELGYFYRFKGDLRDKKVIFYVAETQEEKIKLSSEHKNFKWLNYEEALKQLTFDNSKELLKKADKFIKSL